MASFLLRNLQYLSHKRAVVSLLANRFTVCVDCSRTLCTQRTILSCARARATTNETGQRWAQKMSLQSTPFDLQTPQNAIRNVTAQFRHFSLGSTRYQRNFKSELAADTSTDKDSGFADKENQTVGASDDGPKLSETQTPLDNVSNVHSVSFGLHENHHIDPALQNQTFDPQLSASMDNAYLTSTTEHFAQNDSLQLLSESDRPDSSSLAELDNLASELAAPRPMEPSFNLAPYVSQSEVLQKLVSLGVDLSAMEKVKVAADFVVQANWDADIQPKLLFLKDVGVADGELGTVINRNPLLLKEDIDDMQVRVNYLESKKFEREQVARIVTKAPLTLLLPVVKLDAKLGFLQKHFHLTGDEVRLVATKQPKIIPWRLQKLKDVRFYIKEFLGFSDKEQKAMLLYSPKVYLSDKHRMGKQFDFLHNTMGLTHQQLVQWPKVFGTRLHIIKQRHRFLLSLGRAQYDAEKDNYVSLQALVSGRDREFCHNVAKAPFDQYRQFLKCL